MILTVMLIILDRISKFLIMKNSVNMAIIPGILNFTYVKNRGMVFGIAQGSAYFMGFVSLMFCIAIAGYIIFSKRKNYKYSCGWLLILAGGIGNMIDRFAYGYVVDFIDTPFIATFNIADSFITIGIVIVLIDAVVEEYKNKLTH